MMDEQPGGGRFTLIAGVGMVLCCALPLLLVSGGLGAMMAWLLDGGLLWIALAALAAAAAHLLWRRLSQPRGTQRRSEEVKRN